MTRRQFDRTENGDLRAKIDEAKRRLPLPELMVRLGLGDHAKKSARCLWHDDHHPSFSVFKGDDGFWHYKCFVCDTQGGDEITFLVKHFDISRREAIKRYLGMAGFPPRRSSKSREYPAFPKSPVVHVAPESLVSPVSEGQPVDGELGEQLMELAKRNACTGAGDGGAKKRFKLARDVRAVQKKLGRKLNADERKRVFNEWHRVSEPYLDPAETRDDHFTVFLAELGKVKVPTGEGTITKALENVSKLSGSDLPMIPDWPKAPTKCRRIAALHRELSRLCGGKVYFLSYRDAAKVCDGLSHQEAHTITGALESLGVIKIVSKGKAGLNGGEAAEFRYLLVDAQGSTPAIGAKNDGRTDGCDDDGDIDL